jgi:hypothetical protein
MFIVKCFIKIKAISDSSPKSHTSRHLIKKEKNESCKRIVKRNILQNMNQPKKKEKKIKKIKKLAQAFIKLNKNRIKKAPIRGDPK